MKTFRIVEAMNYIDDDLITEAIEYKPSKFNIVHLRYLGIVACLCLVSFGAIYFFIHMQRRPTTNLTEYSVVAQVIEVLDNGRYKVQVTREDQNFIKNSIVILTPDFNYVSSDSEPNHFKTGDFITVTYSIFNKSQIGYEITFNQIELLPSVSK